MCKKIKGRNVTYKCKVRAQQGTKHVGNVGFNSPVTLQGKAGSSSKLQGVHSIDDQFIFFSYTVPLSEPVCGIFFSSLGSDLLFICP